MIRLKNKKAIYAIVFWLVSVLPIARAQETDTYKFADRDTCSLWLDVYQPADSVRKDICVMYVFGGGFVKGSRTKEDNVRFFKDMVSRGYTVVAIDYRLGLKNVKFRLFDLRPFFRAPEIASEDLISATEFVIHNQEKLRVDPRRIVLIGSSAGAITVLQADHELANRTPMVSCLPSDFRYAAVVSLSGAILSAHGRPKYNTLPAPTLFYHGTKDKIVMYRKLSIFGKGIYGSSSLVKVFKKKKVPFMIVRYKGLKHKVASFTRFEAQDQLCGFIDQVINKGYHNELDITIRDMELQEKYEQ